MGNSLSPSSDSLSAFVLTTKSPRTVLSRCLSLCSGQSTFRMSSRTLTSTDMGSRWFLLLLLLNGDRIFNLPGNVASIPPSSKGVELNKNLSCPSTSSVVSQRTNGPTSTKELNSLSVNKATTSQSQGQMTSATLPTSPQSSSETETTEQTVHTAVKTVTNSMSLLDSTVTSAAKELVESSETTILFTVATPPSPTPDKAIDTNKPLHTAAMTTRDTSSPITANLRTTVLSTGTSESQERDTTTVPPTPATSPTMTSKPQDTHHNTVTQMPSQPAQTDLSDSRTKLTTLPPPRPITTGMRSSVSPSPGEADMTMTTPLMTTTTSMTTTSMTLSTPEDAILSSGTGIPTVPEKLTLTAPSSTLDKAIDTNKPLHMTTVTIRDTSSPTTANLRTVVLSTATSETQERDTTTVPPTPATGPTTMSMSPGTHHSTITQTPSQPQTDSSDSRTKLTTLPPPRPITTGMRSSVSPSPGEADMTVTTTTTSMTTPSTTSSTPEDAILSSGTGIPTVPEKLTLTAPSSTLDKAIDTNKPLHTTTVTTRDTSSPTTANLRTTVLSTGTSETQERDTTTIPPTPATGPTTMSMSPDTHHSTITQTPSQPAQTDSSVSLGTTQSSDHSTALVPSSSETTKSSTMIGTSKAPSNSNQSSGPGGGTCALDEYQASTGGCACNDSYYSHLELSREIATLRCRSQDIEVSLLSCFLKTQHWVLKQDAFAKCSSISTTEEGHRVQVVQVEKKEGSCGLHISTNSSYAVHSLNVHLEQALPGSSNTNFRVLHFSCVYPLAVDVSKPVSHLEISIPSIHVPSSGETVVTLSIFTDSKLSAPLKNSTAPVGLPLYVVLKSTNNDPDRFVLVANEIFASTNDSNAEANDSTYHFVKESCPVQGRMLQDLSNGASMDVTLAFTVSRFLNSDMLYLHAKVTLCDKQVGHPCQPSCSGKNPLRRNSPPDARTGTQKEPSGGKWIVFGPLRISESRASSSGNSAGAWISIFLLIMIGSMLE